MVWVPPPENEYFEAQKIAGGGLGRCFLYWFLSGGITLTVSESYWSNFMYPQNFEVYPKRVTRNLGVI